MTDKKQNSLGMKELKEYAQILYSQLLKANNNRDFDSKKNLKLKPRQLTLLDNVKNKKFSTKGQDLKNDIIKHALALQKISESILDIDTPGINHDDSIKAANNNKFIKKCDKLCADNGLVADKIMDEVLSSNKNNALEMARLKFHGHERNLEQNLSSFKIISDASIGNKKLFNEYQEKMNNFRLEKLEKRESKSSKKMLLRDIRQEDNTIFTSYKDKLVSSFIKESIEQNTTNIRASQIAQNKFNKIYNNAAEKYDNHMNNLCEKLNDNMSLDNNRHRFTKMALGIAKIQTAFEITVGETKSSDKTNSLKENFNNNLNDMCERVGPDYTIEQAKEFLQEYCDTNLNNYQLELKTIKKTTSENDNLEEKIFNAQINHYLVDTKLDNRSYFEAIENEFNSNSFAIDFAKQGMHTRNAINNTMVANKFSSLEKIEEAGLALSSSSEISEPSLSYSSSSLPSSLSSSFENISASEEKRNSKDDKGKEELTSDYSPRNNNSTERKKVNPNSYNKQQPWSEVLDEMQSIKQNPLASGAQKRKRDEIETEQEKPAAKRIKTSSSRGSNKTSIEDKIERSSKRRRSRKSEINKVHTPNVETKSRTSKSKRSRSIETKSTELEITKSVSKSYKDMQNIKDNPLASKPRKRRRSSQTLISEEYKPVFKRQKLESGKYKNTTKEQKLEKLQELQAEVKKEFKRIKSSFLGKFMTNNFAKARAERNIIKHNKLGMPENKLMDMLNKENVAENLQKKQTKKNSLLSKVTKNAKNAQEISGEDKYPKKSTPPETPVTEATRSTNKGKSI